MKIKTKTEAKIINAKEEGIERKKEQKTSKRMTEKKKFVEIEIERINSMGKVKINSVVLLLFSLEWDSATAEAPPSPLIVCVRYFKQFDLYS